MATVEKLEKRKDGKKRHGGKRSGSGRKPALIQKKELGDVKERISKHALVEIKKKSRLLILLDKLFSEGRKGKIPAINSYLDRVIGKVSQPISGPDGGPIEVKEVVVSFAKKKK